MNERIFERVGASMDRMILAMILTCLMAIQIILASKTLTEEEARVLEETLVIGPVTIGAYDALLFFLWLWAFNPVLSYCLGQAFRRGWSHWKDRREAEEVLEL